jgi:hypothetical protein
LFPKEPHKKPKLSKLELYLILGLLLMGLAGIYNYMTFQPKYLFQYLPPPVDDQKLKAQGWEFVDEETQGDPPAKVEVYRRLNDEPKN